MEQLLISKHKKNIYVVLMDDFNRMIECHPFKLSKTIFPRESNVYNGIVRKKVKGIGAYFVDIGFDKDGYLPIDQAQKPLSIGETIMVQVVKEPYGTKGPKLTQFVTFSSENMVLLTDTEKIHFSRKLPEDDKTQSMKKLVQGFERNGLGFIVRTNAYQKSLEDLEIEIEQVIEQYHQVLKKGKFSKAPSCIYEAEKPYLEILKGLQKQHLQRILVDHKEIQEDVEDYLYQYWSADLIPVEFYDSTLYLSFDLEEKIRRVCQRKIWLKSGASLIVDKTEAMTVIDVNSDKNIKNKKQSNNVLAINLEAAKEVARLVRLRNISGIIIVDFIDMELGEHKKHLVEEMSLLMDRDPVLSTVHGLTNLGLMEISRKRTKAGLCEVISSL